MRIITDKEISESGIAPRECVQWVEESFLMKDRAQSPAIISLYPQVGDYINTLRCTLPPEYHTFGCEVVSCIKGTNPELKSKMMLFDTLTGEMTALIDTEAIALMRLCAISTLSINKLRKNSAKTYSFIGNQAIVQRMLDCFLATNIDRSLTVRLMINQDDADYAIERYSIYKNVKWEITDTLEDLFTAADVVVSCGTDAGNVLAEDSSFFNKGVLVITDSNSDIQKCDLTFDKIFADNNRNNSLKPLQSCMPGNLSCALSGQIPGRASEEERILSYITRVDVVQDIFFAKKMLEGICRNNSLGDTSI